MTTNTEEPHEKLQEEPEEKPWVKKERGLIKSFVKVSTLTNRPINKDNPESDLPHFYCTVCRKKISNANGNAINVVHHFVGKHHAEKVNGTFKPKDGRRERAKKRKLKRQLNRLQNSSESQALESQASESYASESQAIESQLKEPQPPVSKKKKNTEPKEKLRCELCNVELSGPMNALEHYKGKRHKKSVRKLDIENY